MPSSDPILVIGGGVNGLACATRLAQAGRSVTLIEAATEPGGAATGWDFAPGFRSPGLAHLAFLLDPRVVAGMELENHGLRFADAAMASVALSAGGDHLTLAGAYGETLAGEGISAQDRLAWADLRARLMRFAAVLAPFRAMVPPRLAGRGSGNEWTRLARIGFDLRRLGRAEFREFLRLILINIWDVLEDDLEDDRLKGLVAFDATLGHWLGPRSPNSLILLLNRLAGENSGRQGALGFPEGGMAAVARAMTGAAKAAGVTIHAGARGTRIIVENDCATGVQMESGEVLAAARVVSALNPKTTLLDLLGVRHLDTGMAHALRHQKSRGAAARLNLALSGLPDLRGADPRARLVIAPSATAVDMAFNPVKYGEVPEHPVMEVIFPSAHGPGFAPKGQHSLSAIVQFAPHDPKAGQDAARAAMLENSLAVLEAHLPGIRDLVSHAEMLMPCDIAARFGMPDSHHGELSVEQMLFLRPVPGLSQYETPVAGLWLAGAGSHPGGGISGASGWNAAERILKGGRE
ncbi:MAG: phytoene desaturase family protein [Pseudorhodobacter sp.]